MKPTNDETVCSFRGESEAPELINKRLSQNVMGMEIGLLGMLFLILAWIPEILETIRKKGKRLNMQYLLLIIGGDILLLIYSIQIGDPVFITLNIILLLMALIELYYTVRKKK